MTSRRRTVGACVAAVVAVAVAAVVVVGVGDDEGPDDARLPAGSDWTGHQQELLESVQPSPDCPDAAPLPAASPGQVLIDVLRVEGTCLVSEAEAVPAGQVDARLRELRGGDDVLAADRIVDATFAGGPPADEDVHDALPQWALTDLDAPAARALWPAGGSVVVSVIDAGIDADHPDLAGTVRDAVPDGRPGVGPGSGHGTHVAGIIAAADDGSGVEGLMPAVDLLDAQFLEVTDEDPDGEAIGPLSERIRWSVDHGAQVVNMSVTESDPSETSAAAVRYARLHRVVLVAAVGNMGTDGDEDAPIRYPAGYEGVIGVAAYDAAGDRASFSQNNTSVDLAAPGVEVMSTWRREAPCFDGYVDEAEHDGNGDIAWCDADGTSMASPYVAAAAALLKARQPTADPDQVTRALLTSARPPPDETATGRFYGAGRLDPSAAAVALGEIMANAPEDDSDVPLVAFQADGATTLSVLDPATGQVALLAHVDGSAGTPSHPLRWSPDGRHVAGRTDGGYVTVWDTDTLAFGSGEPSPPIEVAPDTGVGGRVADMVFVDDATLALLIADEALGVGAIPAPAGHALRYYDIATGELSAPVATPPLARLIGHRPDDDVVLAMAGGPDGAIDPPPHALVWLARDGRQARTAELGHPGDEVVDAVLSPDGDTVAVSLSVPERDLTVAGELGDPYSSLFTVDAASGAVTEVEPPGPGEPRRIRHLRWTDDSDDLVANLLYTPATRPLTPDGDEAEVLEGLAVHDGDTWYQLDTDALLAGKTVGDRAQVILTDGQDEDLHRNDELFLVLPGAVPRDVGDAYAGPLDAAPVATWVSGLWFGPGSPEPPFRFPDG